MLALYYSSSFLVAVPIKRFTEEVANYYWQVNVAMADQYMDLQNPTLSRKMSK